MKQFVLLMSFLVSFQSFGSTIQCYSEKYARDVIIIGLVPDKGNMLCMSVFLSKTGRYALNCKISNSGREYSVNGTTQAGVSVNAKVNVVSGKATINGENLELNCK